ncbi:MAG TPA: metallophosphoesterase [Thermoanaerobaculia bacterium]|jgi:predicted phosphodiesterase|nr:metallophosphoesterase [Thermoanaerobaculia bacterium]
MFARAIVFATAFLCGAGLLCGAGNPAGVPLPEISLAAHNGTLRLAVVGDAGLQTNTIASAITKSKPYDAILLLGDNFYPCGVRSATDPKWHVVDAITHLDIPIYAVLGNHDYCGKPDAQVNANVPNWHMPAREYVLHSPLADFAMLDTTPYAYGKSKIAEETLRETFASSTATWRIAVGHHVITSSGYHSIIPRAEARRMRGLLPVLRNEKVDLYLDGHDHHEELLNLNRPLILVSGAGSDPVPMITVRDQTVWPKETHFREPIAFASLEITKDALTIEFINAKGKKIAGPFRYSR